MEIKHDFVQRIYKIYISIGDISEQQCDKYCAKFIKKFKRGLDPTKQKVFLITNRDYFNDIRIITTYFDIDRNQYYTQEF